MILDEDHIKEAIQRIARTPDGQVFRIALQRAMMAIEPSPDSGALQVFEGGRRFASQIASAMDAAIAGEALDGQRIADRPIVIVAKRPVHTGAGGGARRRVQRDPAAGRPAADE